MQTLPRSNADIQITDRQNENVNFIGPRLSAPLCTG
jgi:hypothetical protein